MGKPRDQADQPPVYQPTGQAPVPVPAPAATAAEPPQHYTRYDTMTSYAGLDGQPEGPKGHPAAVQPGSTSYIVTNTMVAGALDEPFPIACPYCRAVVQTKTKHVAGCMAFTSCLIVGVLTSCMCCLVPLCMDRCRDVKHYCPECNHLIAIYKRL